MKMNQKNFYLNLGVEQAVICYAFAHPKLQLVGGFFKQLSPQKGLKNIVFLISFMFLVSYGFLYEIYL